MPINAYAHMEDAWSLEANPFPQDAVSDDEGGPYAELYPDETLEFESKFVRGGVSSGLKLAYLWSRNPTGDTGFGKTRLMRHMRSKINADLGNTVQAEAGMREERRVPIAAAYTTLNGTTATGLYQVYYAGVADLNTSHDGTDAPLIRARERIISTIARSEGIDPAEVPSQAIVDAVVAARRSMAPGGVPLRSDLVRAFATGPDYLAIALSEVTEATRMRSGMQFLDFALAALGAAGIDHLFILVDQLEDLATNLGITSAKRSKEIGRIRDLLEEQPYASRLHQVLTFHSSAAIKLARYWEPQRLPRFDIAPDNMSVIVELKGMTTDDQASDVIKAYLEEKRLGPALDELAPFEPGAVAVLRAESKGRVGILLTKAHGLFHAAAEAGLGTIDADFATRFFSGTIAGATADGHSEPAEMASGIDDLLLK
jgi:hypothetical protein